jgi:hypothetical protein
VYTIIGITGSSSRPVIIFRVVLIAIAMSTLLTILYISDARTLRALMDKVPVDCEVILSGRFVRDNDLIS